MSWESDMDDLREAKEAAVTGQVHIAHYFPKGYDPQEEPWRSIRQHHDTATAKEREISDGLGKLNDKLRKELELAWGIIANAAGGDWTKESKEWQDAAARWRDRVMKNS
jgi:hypothetical protein